MIHLKRIAVATGIVVGAASAQACSVCIAHALGSAVHSVGAQSLPKGSTVVAISYTAFNKSQDGEANGEGPAGTESHSQRETDFHIVHGLAEQWMVRADVPLVYKRLSLTGENPINTSGLGDITFGLTYQSKPKPNDKVLFATTFDVKLPTGASNIDDGAGVRLEEHSQVGTGSTDFAIGILATTELKNGDLAFGGLNARVNGSNGSGYRYGNVLFYNFGVSHNLSESSSVVFELNGRIAAKDRQDSGARDDDSGGHFGYLSTSYRQSLGHDCGLLATYQLPVIRALNGSQKESGLLTVGIYRKL